MGVAVVGTEAGVFGVLALGAERQVEVETFDHGLHFRRRRSNLSELATTKRVAPVSAMMASQRLV